MAEGYTSVDKFDRIRGSLENLPVVTRTRPSTVATSVPVIGATQTFIIETFRQREVGDFIFLQYVDDTGSIRLAIPPAAAEVIARQRDAVATVRDQGRWDAAAAHEVEARRLLGAVSEQWGELTAGL